MNWVVITDRDGEQFQIMTREERETMLGLYKKMRIRCPTYVVKVLDSEEKAQTWVSEIKTVNKLISDI